MFFASLLLDFSSSLLLFLSFFASLLLFLYFFFILLSLLLYFLFPLHWVMDLDPNRCHHAITMQVQESRCRGVYSIVALCFPNLFGLKRKEAVDSIGSVFSGLGLLADTVPAGSGAMQVLLHC